MSTPIRLSDNLVQDAEAESAIHRRSPPKQIEYWAAIGKAVARQASSNDLLALLQGFAQVEVRTQPFSPVDAQAVFTSVKQAQATDQLRDAVSQSQVRYEASQTHPGMLDRIDSNGHRETGQFRDGVFTPVT